MSWFQLITWSSWCESVRAAWGFGMPHIMPGYGCDCRAFVIAEHLRFAGLSLWHVQILDIGECHVLQFAIGETNRHCLQSSSNIRALVIAEHL